MFLSILSFAVVHVFTQFLYERTHLLQPLVALGLGIEVTEMSTLFELFKFRKIVLTETAAWQVDAPQLISFGCRQSYLFFIIILVKYVVALPEPEFAA